MRKSLRFSLLTAALILCVALGVRGYVLQVASGTWAPQANLWQARSGASAVLLQDGRVLITGGDGTAGTLVSAEIVGTDGTSSAAAPMNIARGRHVSVMLANGNVLVAGGTTSGGGATNAAEIYDPLTDSWTTVPGGMTEARSNATAVLLKDGRVLIAGGDKSGVASASLEVFDPIAGAFSFAGALSSPRTEHAMALLPDGRVFITGGSNGSTAVNSTDIYDSVAGNVGPGPAMSTPRSGHSATAMLDGTVLIAGGNNGSADLASAEVFDPAMLTMATVASSLAVARQGHLAFLLPNNNTVLIVGGTSAGTPLASAEKFTPRLGTFSPTGSLSSARSLSAGNPMKQDGLLLVAGGQDASGVAISNKDLYGFATVKTDAADYAPGTTVNITGSGWQPGETVSLTLVEQPLFDTHGPFTVLADSNGSISDSSFATDEHDLNISFVLTATGSVSEAQTIFKDSKPNTVTVGAQTPDPVAPGGSAQYTVTVNFNGNGSACTSPLSIQNPAVLPAGATATFSPTSVTSTGGNATSTLTITTTNSTPPTATPISFTVLAANGGGTCQGGTATGTGTLTVVESTTSTLTSSVNPSVFGQSTTLTATVAKTSGPTSVNAGSVTFKDGATTLGTVSVNASGVATLGVSSLTAVSHSLAASYAGTAIFGASNSNTVLQTVNQASTITTLISGANPSSSGQSVTFTATVAAIAPGSGTATGTVTFKDGATTIGTGTLAGNTATLATSALTVGSHSITATYNGDTNFTGSTSSALSQTVNQASTTTTITAHTPSPSVVGQVVNITFTVTGGGGTPTGNVTVNDGAAGDSCTATVAVGNCSITFPTSGTKTLSAIYAGDTNFTGSTSANVSHTVNTAATTTTITAHTPNPSVIGQAITVNYSVTVNAPGSGTIPGTDNVTVSDGTGDSCTATVATGTCQLTPTTAGAKTLTAGFATGDSNFATSTSAGVSHTVNKRNTTTSLSLSLTNVLVGQPSSATVTVTDSDSGAQSNPTGVITLSSSDTGDAFGTCTLAPSGANAATCTASVTPSKVGTNPHTVTATFPADASHATSNGTASLTVNKANTTTTISSNTPNPSTAGQTITVNFAVTVNSPGAGTLTGNVTVSDGAGSTCSATVTAGSCQITIGTAGAKTLTATYAGDANFLTSASVGTSQTVNPKLAITSNVFATVTGICSPQISVQTQNADGSASNQTPARTLTPSSSSANGKFFSDSGCSTQVNNVAIAAGSSTATFFYSDTSIGSPLVTVASTNLASAAQIEGETGLRFSNGAFTSPVGQCSAAMTLQSANAQTGGPTSLTQGTTISLNTSSGGGTFYGDATCATLTTSVVIGPGFDAGHDSPNFFYKDTTAGSPLVTALAGTASATQTETITKITPAFTVPASQSTTFGTASITLSGTLAAGTSFPLSGETVSITTNSVATIATLGVNGSFSATINTSAIPASVTAYAIVYSYAGDTNFNGTTNNTTTLTVNKAATGTAVVSSLNPSFSGQQVTFTSTVTVPAGVPTGTIQFQDGGINLGSAVTLTNVGGVFSAHLQTSGLSVGTHSITAVYSGDTNFTGSASSVVTQTVKSAVTSTSISAPSITFGADGAVTVTVAAQDSSAGTPTGSVTLSVDGGAALSQSLVNGTAAFTIPNPSAGDHSLSASYAAQNNFNASSATGTLHVNQSEATLSFGTLTFSYDGSPKPVTVTTTPANLPGVTVLYDGGTTPPTNAGTTPVTATLTNSNYAATPISGAETIQAAAVVITVSDPIPTYDGNPHQAFITVVPQVSVAVTYNGSATSPTNAGTYAVSVTTMDSNYAGVGSGTLTIKQAAPSITWNNPADISFGTALSGIQLNAASNVPGAFAYSPSAGTVLDAGDGQTLTVDFTPTDTTNYSTVSGTHVSINVEAAALYVVSSDGSRTFGQPNPTFTPTFIGLTNGDTPNSIGTVICQSAAGTSSEPGTYPAKCSGVNSTNYSAHYIAGTLSVTNPLSAITEIKGASSNSETLTIGQSDLLTATGNFADSSMRALSVAGGSSYAKTPMLTPVSGAAMAEAGGALYAIGGFDGTNTSATIQAYDPKNDSWAVLANTVALATPRRNAAVASVAGKIYVIGGTDAANHALASVEVLDTTGANPVVSVFSSSLSTARSASGAAAFNNKLYVIGGSDTSNSALSSVEIFDLVTGAVSTADAGTALAQASAAVVNKNNTAKLYVAGVSGSSIVMINFDGMNWSSPVSTTLDASQGVGAASLGELLYMVNGADVWSYDGNSFVHKNSLGNAHNATQPVSIGTLIYEASAGSGSANSNLDAFAPDEVKWTSADATKATVNQSGNVSALAITAPTVAITAASLSGPNISADFLLTIIKKTQTIQFDPLLGKTYGDADFSVSAISLDSTSTPTGLMVGFTTGSADSCTVGVSTLSAGVSSANVHITGAGNCTITAAQPGDDTTWMAATSVSQNFTIAKTPLSVTADNANRFYGASNPSFTGNISGIKNSDNITATYASTATPTSAAGLYPIVPTLVDPDNKLGNYIVTSTNGTLTVKAVSITVTAYAKTKAYGDTDPTLTYTITSGSLFNGDMFSGSLTRAAGENVGDYAITQGSLVLSDNYILTYVGANLTIVVRPVTVTADGQTKVYGYNDPLLTYKITVGSLVAGDVFSGGLTRTAGENVGTYAIGLGSLVLSTNYNLNYVGANLVITARPITVTADGQTKVYGYNDPSLTYKITVGSLVAGDVFSGGLTRAIGESVGTYAIGQGTLALSTNYNLNYVGANLVITARPITVTADGQTKVYGYNDPSLTYKLTVGSLVAGDVFSGGLSRAIGESVGTYTIGQGSLVLSTNYNLNYVGANLVITARPITVTADGQTKVYGYNDPSLTYKLTVGSLVAGDVFSGGLTRAAGESVGTYTIGQGTLALSTNYNLNYVGADLVITARPIIVTADGQTKVYGYNDPTLTYMITTGTLVTGDVFSGGLTRAAGESVGTYTIGQGSLALSTNYNLTYVGANLLITARAVTVTANPQGKLFGQPDPPLTFQTTVGSLVSSDTFAGGLVRIVGEAPGTYPILRGSLTLSSNYTLSYVGANLAIAQASTATSVSSSGSPSNWGQVVIFTATVSDSTLNSAGTPTGMVNFYNAASGATCQSLASANVLPLDTEPLVTIGSSQQASTSTPTLPVGNNTILACYNGDINFNGSNGTVPQTVVAAPIANLSPSSLSFGNQQGGTTSGPQTVSISNLTGTAPLLISSIKLAGTNPTYFTETDSCSNVAVGGSCVITVRFAPPATTTGVATAVLVVTDNDENTPGSTQSSLLTGAGTSSINSVGSLSTYGIFATANGCSSINMSGNAVVDSFNSASNNNGNVGTNGNVNLSGNPVVNGAVYSPITGTGNCSSKSMTGLSTSGKAQATGGLQALAGPLAYPAPPAPSPAPPTTAQNISGSCGSIAGCSNAGSKAVTLAPGQYGNLSISGGTTVNVSGGTYNVNSLTLSGNSALVVNSASGPVVVNLAGKSITGGNAVLDLTGGVMSNASGRANNLQFYYAGSQAVKLTGNTASYAMVYAPNAPVNLSGGSHFYGAMTGSTINNSGGTAIHYDASLPNIPQGDYIWFNSAALNVQGLPTSGSVKVYVTNASISFLSTTSQCSVPTISGRCTLPVPNAVITFSSTATTANTTWDATNNRWSTLVPTNGYSSLQTRAFIDGLAYLAPASFPAGIQNVTWSAAFSTSTPGLNFSWQWGAAVYTSFSSNYTLLNVNPIDGADPAGTPESYKNNLIFGAMGPGYVGLNTAAAGVVPTIAEASVSPSSLDFSNGGVINQTVGTASGSLTAVLTNNMSGPLTISSVQITGTNPGDFTQVNNCPVSPSTLASGGNCTIAVTFKPTGTNKRTAKIVVNDTANNSPQTVFLKGTGQ